MGSQVMERLLVFRSLGLFFLLLFLWLLKRFPMSCWAAVKIAIMGEEKTGGMQGKSVPLGEGMERQK